MQWGIRKKKLNEVKNVFWYQKFAIFEQVFKRTLKNQSVRNTFVLLQISITAHFFAATF